MENPLVSIGLLTYNHDKYIANALDGLLSQEYKTIEVIILNDASCDNTSLIIEQYMPRMVERFTRVIYLKNEVNCGNISRNCNQMIRKARGDFYYEISGDDIVLPHAVRLLYEAFQAHPECSVVHGNMVEVSDTYAIGDSVDLHNVTNKGRESGVEPDNLFQKLMCSNCISAPATMLRRELFDKYGYHDEAIIHEDFEYWLRISPTEKFFFLNEPLVLYRRAEVSVTNFNSTNNHIKIQEAMNAVFLARQKYVDRLSDDERSKCWQACFSFYFQLCAQNRYQEGIDWLDAKGKEMGLAVDEYRTDCEKGQQIAEKEKKIAAFWEREEKEPHILGDYLKGQNIVSAAIYGYSPLGRTLHRELEKEGIDVNYIIDRKGDLLVCQLPVFTLEQPLPSTDLIIVAPVGIYESVQPQLAKKTDAEIMDLGQIIETLELLP